MKHLFYAIFTFLLIVTFFITTQFAQADDIALLQISSPDGKPLKNIPIYIFNGDIESKGSASELYPYSSTRAKTKMTYLGEVKTDENGNFTLLPISYTQRKLILSTGSITAPIALEKSSDLSHTPSEDHLRVIEWADENGTVKANHIYNWRKGTVLTVPMGQNPLTEARAQTIVLNTYYIRKIAPWVLPALSDSDAMHLRRQLEQMTYQANLLEQVHAAMTYPDANLRTLAATYLGKFGTYKSVSFLMDELSLGKDKTSRAAAVSALQTLSGETFGDDLTAWREWLSERNQAIEKIEKYLNDTGKTDLEIYRIHLNKEKTQWGASLQRIDEPDSIGAPALMVNRTDGTINFIKGR